MRIEIVDQDGNTLVRRDNEQIVPSIGDEIHTKEEWYTITDRTFFYRDNETTVHMLAKLIEGA